MLEPSIQYCIDIIIAILQNTNLLNDNFSFCTSLNRLYVVRRYVVVKEEMTNQPNVLYIGISCFRHLHLVHKFITICCTVAPVYVYTHTHAYTHTQSCMNAYTHVHTHTCTYMHMQTYMHTGGHHTRASMHTHTHTWGYTHAHTLTHIHVHTHSRARTHTHRYDRVIFYFYPT